MFKQFLIALDQLLNTFCGGMADETISARAYRSGWTRREKVINFIFNDPKHCEDSYASEVKRSQFPEEYRVSPCRE